jgi:hypothetical protein
LIQIEQIFDFFLPKIRSKETNKLLSDSIDHNKQMLSRLEQTIEIVQQYFIAERAISLDLDRVAKQVRDCHSGPLSYGKYKILIEFYFQITNHHLGQSTETLHFLQTYPANNGWLSIITIRGRHFIKVNRHKSINTIIEAIQRELQN